MLKEFFVDLHIHVGRNELGKPVKITGSKKLTINNIMIEANDRKGIDMVGVIDCQAPAVLHEIKKDIISQRAVELAQGGIRYGQTTLLLGSEIEVYDKNARGPIHVLCFFPFLSVMEKFSDWLASHMKNIELSSQRFYGDAIELQKKTRQLGGLFIPAHVFTPFKSVYGKGVVKSLTEILDPTQIDAIELGLSSDTQMADQIEELHEFTFVTNSDAHSLAKIAREYQMIEMETPTFHELKLALYRKNGRKIKKNFGMNPKLGKYYSTVCAKCLHPFNREQCANCGSVKYIRGVSDRIRELRTASNIPQNRSPYIYQVPLEYIPGLGPKTFDKLLAHFGTEMNVIHFVPEQNLIEVVGEKTANKIIDLRNGKLSIQEGGGGRYGKIK